MNRENAVVEQYRRRRPVLPAPLAKSWDWQLKGACKQSSVDFFPSQTLLRDQLARVEEAAKNLCACCAVRQRCLDYAMSSNEPYGIWGGMTSRERALRQARPTTR